MLSEFIRQPRIAYFSMEIALRDEIPTYSGGLGGLAGDTMRSAADLELPLVGVSLVSRAGYFRQEIVPPGKQVEKPAFWEPRDWTTALNAKVAIHIEGREVWIRGWLYVLTGHMGGAVPILLLDTFLDENTAADKEITHYLYGGDDVYRLKQEMVLGIGGVRMLHALGFRVRQYHMNEGHAALLALELLRRFARTPEETGPGNPAYDVPRVRALCNFTTHTPVEAGHDQFSYDLVQRVMGDFMELPELQKLAGAERLNLTRLALNLSEYVNGVAKRHAEVSAHLFPGYRVHAVTNGVHPYTWTSKSFIELYDAHLPYWCHEPEILVRVDQLADRAIWEAHTTAKQRLLERVKEICGIALNPEVFTLGFARRMAVYKRADLLFSDLERLKSIARRFPLQIVLAGKAHPRDDGGKWLIEVLHQRARELAGTIDVVFLPDYRLSLSLAMVSGVDLWLNTPQRPLEASGTSGMKAAFNGVPNLSVLDGWWIEGCIEGVTGWAIGDTAVEAKAEDDARSLYNKLEQQILPLYYGSRTGWIAVMKGAISKNAYFFNSHRMMRRYTAEAYMR